jgi:hypothetical protein
VISFLNGNSRQSGSTGIGTDRNRLGADGYAKSTAVRFQLRPVIRQAHNTGTDREQVTPTRFTQRRPSGLRICSAMNSEFVLSCAPE